MRIIVMTNRFGDLGTHPQLTELAIHLKGAGHDVRAISLGPTGSIVPMFAEAGIRTDVIDASSKGSFVAVVARLASLFRRRRPEAVIAFLYESIMPARLAGRLAGVPVVISSIRNEYFGRRYREVFIKLTQRLSDATVVNSEIVAESLIRRRVASRKQLVVVPNAVDASRFRPAPQTRDATRRRSSIAAEDFLWLSMGRLGEQKAYPTLLRAFVQVVEAIPSSKLLVAGRGPMHDELQRLIHRFRLQDSVSLLGYRDDVPELLSAADAFVMASRYEGMPNAMMQAMAAGLPVVGTDVGGIPELIRNKVNGYIVPAGDAAALARDMVRLSTATADERRTMGSNGRTLIEERFSTDRVMDLWLDLIDRCSNHGATSRFVR